MSAPFRRARRGSEAGWGLSVVLALVGCTGSLDPSEIVKTPRVLAVVAEPPESAPGTDIAVDAMISVPAEAPRPLALRWRACLDAASVLRDTGLPVEVPGRPECQEATLAEGVSFVVEGARTRALFDALASFAPLLGARAALLDLVLSTVGVAFEVELEVLDATGRVRVSAYKRVALTGRASPTTNPPPPRFRLDDALEIVPDGRFTCRAADGRTPRLRAGAEVPLEPLLPDGSGFGDGDSAMAREPWLETFPVFDYTGGLTQGEEGAYYAWFATGGRLGEAITARPERGTRWTTPEEPGPASLWLVVRDGHLGTSACRLDVTLE